MVVLPDPLVGEAMRNADFMVQKYKIISKSMVYSQIIRTFAPENWQSGGRMPPDARESGESPELYLQL